MKTTEKTNITVETFIKAPIGKVWSYWNDPKHIVNWYFASDDWHAPAAENDLSVDGKLKVAMAEKNGSVSFDFEGTYTQVEPFRHIAYTILDGRLVDVNFQEQDNGVKLTETFEAENTHSIDVQREGWQAMLENFRNYTEGN